MGMHNFVALLWMVRVCGYRSPHDELKDRLRHMTFSYRECLVVLYEMYALLESRLRLLRHGDLFKRLGESSRTNLTV